MSERESLIASLPHELRKEADGREAGTLWPHKMPFYDRNSHMLDYQQGYVAALRAVAERIERGQ